MAPPELSLRAVSIKAETKSMVRSNSFGSLEGLATQNYEKFDGHLKKNENCLEVSLTFTEITSANACFF